MKASLVPFQPCPGVESLRFDLTLVSSGRLAFNVTLTGPTASGLPLIQTPGQRRSGLWNDHCFELFIGKAGSKAYWEWNLAPSGDWQCFQFDQYRANRTLSESLRLDNCSSSCFENTYSLSAEIILISSLIRQRELFKIGICAVIRSQEGLSYFALRHGHQPDFHDQRQYVEITL